MVSLIVGTESSIGPDRRLIVPGGTVIDDFERDDGWPGDRAATCGNMWACAVDPGNAAYLLGGKWTKPPGAIADGGGTIYIGNGGQSVEFIVTMSSGRGSDQEYWVVDLQVDMDDPLPGRKNVQLEVSNRNSFVVWYDPPSLATNSPKVFAAGVGQAQGTTMKYRFATMPGTSSTAFTVVRSAVDGSGATTIMSGTTSPYLIAGPGLTISGSVAGHPFHQITRLGISTTTYSNCNVVSDAFNRPNYGDGTLGFADSGQRWFIAQPSARGATGLDGSTWTTQGTNVNKAQSIAPALDRYRVARTLINTGGNNQDVSFTFSTADDDYIGCHVRCNAVTDNGYEIVLSAYGGSGVYKNAGSGTGGTGTQIASFSDTTLNTTHTARVIAKDNNLKVYRDGTLLTNLTINPDDLNGYSETDWTYFCIQQNHGGPGGSAPRPTTGPNLLTSNQSTLESGTIAGWAAEPDPSFGTTYTVLTADTAHAHGGTYSLKAGVTAATGRYFSTPPGLSGFRVRPGGTYAVNGWVWREDSSGQSRVRVAMRWYDSSGSLISQMDGSDMAPVRDSWSFTDFKNTSNLDYTAPTGAAYGQVYIQCIAANNLFILFWFDDMAVREVNSGTVYANTWHDDLVITPPT